MSFILSIIKHDFNKAYRNNGDTLNLVMFFFISVIIFAFGVGSVPKYLSLNFGVGVIWVCALFSAIISLPCFYDDDFEDGTLAQYFLVGKLPEYIIMAKIISHFVVYLLPLVLISPFLAILLDIEPERVHLISYTLLLGTPILSMVGSIGAAVTIGTNRAGGLLAILILPLYIPALIFGTSAVIENEGYFSPSIMILIGILMFMLPISVIASSAAIKIAIEDC